MDYRTRCRMLDCWQVAVEDSLVCEEHLREVGEVFFQTRTPFGVRHNQRVRSEQQRLDRVAEIKLSTGARQRSVVYYVRIGDHVKIGYTSMLPTRVNGLRVDADMCLAAEPGWREQEARRHAQFAAERVGKREDFNPSPRLIAHIDAVSAAFGEPYALASRLADEYWAEMREASS